MTDLHLSDHRDSLKMLRETMCLAQTAIGHAVGQRLDEHIARLGRVIAEIDRQRPLGVDGKHGDRHTPTCGCESSPPFHAMLDELLAATTIAQPDAPRGIISAVTQTEPTAHPFVVEDIKRLYDKLSEPWGGRQHDLFGIPVLTDEGLPPGTVLIAGPCREYGHSPGSHSTDEQIGCRVCPCRVTLAGLVLKMITGVGES